MTRHLTPGEQRTQTAAAAAVARAMRHVRPPEPPRTDDEPDSWITPARARQIRQEIESERP